MQLFMHPMLIPEKTTIPTHSIHYPTNVYLAKTRAGSLNFHYSLFVILYPEKLQLIHSGSRNNGWASGTWHTQRSCICLGQPSPGRGTGGGPCSVASPRSTSMTRGKEPRLERAAVADLCLHRKMCKSSRMPGSQEGSPRR